jgi:hypothetical protein
MKDKRNEATDSSFYLAHGQSLHEFCSLAILDSWGWSSGSPSPHFAAFLAQRNIYSTYRGTRTKAALKWQRCTLVANWLFFQDRKLKRPFKFPNSRNGRDSPINSVYEFKLYSMGIFALQREWKRFRFGWGSQIWLVGFIFPASPLRCSPRNVTSWVHSKFDS